MKDLFFMGFVPHRLQVLGRPELAEFPLNLLLADENGKTTLFQPDLSTWQSGPEEDVLLYRSPNLPSTVLRLGLDRKQGARFAEKLLEGRGVGLAMGKLDPAKPELAWSKFFVQVSLLGRG